MGWRNPHQSTMRGPDSGVLRRTFESLSSWASRVDEWRVMSQEVGATGTVDLEQASHHLVTLTANCTLELRVPQDELPRAGILSLIQDGTGGRTVTWPANSRWPGSTPPTLTAAADKADVFHFVTFGGQTVYLTEYGLDYA